MTLDQFLLDDSFSEEQKRRIRSLKAYCLSAVIDVEIDDIIISDDPPQLTLRVALDFQ
jgi:hypothetical protein